MDGWKELPNKSVNILHHDPTKALRQREEGREVGRWVVRSGGECTADGIGSHFGHAAGEDTVTHYILTRASSAVSTCAFVLVKQVK